MTVVVFKGTRKKLGYAATKKRDNVRLVMGLERAALKTSKFDARWHVLYRLDK